MEECDDGNTQTVTVVLDCQNENNGGDPRCGDNVVDANEECDDGNSMDGDGCSSLCLVEDAASESLRVILTALNSVVKTTMYKRGC